MLIQPDHSSQKVLPNESMPNRNFPISLGLTCMYSFDEFAFLVDVHLLVGMIQRQEITDTEHCQFPCSVVQSKQYLELLKQLRNVSLVCTMAYASVQSPTLAGRAKDHDYHCHYESSLG